MCLARERLLQGRPVMALAALRRALRVSRSRSTKRALRRAVTRMPGLIEKEAFFEPLRVTRETYDAVFARFCQASSAGGRAALPRRMDERAIVLHNLRIFFDPTLIYGREAVDALLGEAVEAFGVASSAARLRQSMVDMRLLRRTVDGAIYWVNAEAPLEVLSDAA